MNSLLCLVMLLRKLIIQHVFVMTNLGLSVMTSHLLLRKCIAADTDYILFYVLTSGPANSFGTSALLSPSRISVGVGSACMSSPVSTPVRPAAFTPDSAPRARSFNQPTADSRLLTPFSSVDFSHLTAPRLLRNIGNSCFFNSIIQCLIACSRVAPNRVVCWSISCPLTRLRLTCKRSN